MTVGRFIQRCSKTTFVAPFGRERTSAMNLCAVSICSRVGQEEAETLNAADVQRFLPHKLDSGLSSATVYKLHVVFTKHSSRLYVGLAPRNVADDLDAPKIHKGEVTPLTAEEERKLLETARGDTMEALYVVAVQSGLRQGSC